MNKNNTIRLGSALNPLTGLSTVNYKIYYYDYSTSVQGERKLLYIGKAYNFTNAAYIDIWCNDIIKNFIK